MAKYAAEGAGVTLVTCTLGELGEIIPPELAHLAWDKDNGLGQYRIGELDAACEALGVQRSPVSRRARPLARLGDDGHPVERLGRRVLAR